MMHIGDDDQYVDADAGSGELSTEDLVDDEEDADDEEGDDWNDSAADDV